MFQGYCISLKILFMLHLERNPFFSFVKKRLLGWKYNFNNVVIHRNTSKSSRPKINKNINKNIKSVTFIAVVYFTTLNFMKDVSAVGVKNDFAVFLFFYNIKSYTANKWKRVELKVKLNRKSVWETSFHSKKTFVFAFAFWRGKPNRKIKAIETSFESLHCTLI